MTSADNKLVSTIFRGLELAMLGGVGRIDVEASTPDSMAAITMLTIPTHVADRVLKQLEMYARDLGREN